MATAVAERLRLTRQKSAEAVVPAGIVSREGPNVRRADRGWSSRGSP